MWWVSAGSWTWSWSWILKGGNCAGFCRLSVWVRMEREGDGLRRKREKERKRERWKIERGRDEKEWQEGKNVMPRSLGPIDPFCHWQTSFLSTTLTVLAKRKMPGGWTETVIRDLKKKGKAKQSKQVPDHCCPGNKHERRLFLLDSRRR